MKNFIGLLLFVGLILCGSQGFKSEILKSTVRPVVCSTPLQQNQETESTNVRFIVHVDGPDCPAFQYCVVKVILYYSQTMAELASQDYKYGEDEYIFDIGYVNDSYDVCATSQIEGECQYSLTIYPYCCSSCKPYTSPPYDLYPTYDCD